MVGGRTEPLGSHFAALGPRDFKAKTFDGLGDDWPISYDQVSPYYDKLELAGGGVSGCPLLPKTPTSCSNLS